jgi:folate-binding protein YgfZ
LLSTAGAVAELESSTVSWHYGDPLREQRTLDGDGAIVERARDIVTVTGPERLTWLHSITTQHLTQLPADTGTELLVLSPHGHIEHHAGVFDDGTTTWLDTRAGQGAALADFLVKMRFFTEVEIADVTEQYAFLTVTGPTDLAAADTAELPDAKFASGTLPERPTSLYAGASTDDGWARRTDALTTPTVDIVVKRDRLGHKVTELGRPLAGTWAFDTLRIPCAYPEVGVDTDHKTIPHEVPWLLVAAVHLDKGCYRGQETVARVHNLGKPPRMLSILHLDGISEHAPEAGTDITLDGRVVGRVGTASRHYEDGMIALALLRRNVREREDPKLSIGDTVAAL